MKIITRKSFPEYLHRKAKTGKLKSRLTRYIERVKKATDGKPPCCCH